MPHHDHYSPLRRKLLLGALGGLTTLGVPSALASDLAYPSRPLRFICPWPAGGTSDSIMSNLVSIVSRNIGAEIVLENRAGGSGMIGTQSLVSAAPDGYTIGQVPLSVARFWLLGKLAFDPLKDIQYICRVSGQTFGIAVMAGSQFKSLQQLVQYAKSRPGQLRYGHSGIASSAHIAMELFLREAGIDIVGVPFKGGLPALAAMQRGEVDLLADSPSWSSFAKTGQMRLLATWSAQRLPRHPHVPTMREAGYDLIVDAPNGIGAPAGLSSAITDRLRDAFKTAVLSEKFLRICEAQDAPVMYQDADEYRQHVELTLAQEAKIIQRIKLAEQLATAS